MTNSIGRYRMTVFAFIRIKVRSFNNSICGTVHTLGVLPFMSYDLLMLGILVIMWYDAGSGW